MQMRRSRRRTGTGGALAVLMLSAVPSSATVMEFDADGRVTVRPTINYQQRARLAASPAPAGGVSGSASANYIEQTVNNNQPVALGTPAAAVDTGTFVELAALPTAAFLEAAGSPRVPPGAMTFLPSPEPASGLRGKVAEIARAHGIPPRLFLALIEAESGFDPEAVSPKGAIGLAQLMPATAKELGVDPTDPLENLSGGARYLARQYARFGSWDLAIAAYNAGPARVARVGGVPAIPETERLVARVMGKGHPIQIAKN